VINNYGRLLSAKAVKTLRDCLDSPKEGDRIRAATAILDRAVQGVELLDLAERIEELERRERERKDKEKRG